MWLLSWLIVINVTNARINMTGAVSWDLVISCLFIDEQSLTTTVCLNGRKLTLLIADVLVRFQFRNQTSDALLELAVLGSVDERVDTAVGERQCHGDCVDEVICESTGDQVDEHYHQAWCPAYNESTTHHQRRNHCIASGCGYCRTGTRSHLKEIYNFIHNHIAETNKIYKIHKKINKQ